MTRKVTHEVKLPKSLTVAIYIITIAVALNVVKPFVGVAPAFADLDDYDTLKISHSGYVEVIN